MKYSIITCEEWEHKRIAKYRDVKGDETRE
jgi:hypothetical protein